MASFYLKKVGREEKKREKMGLCIRNNLPHPPSPGDSRDSGFTFTLACVASVSVWFWRKEIPRKGTFGFDRARNETRAKKFPALLLAPLFSRSLTLVPRSFLLNRTETLATQATFT